MVVVPLPENDGHERSDRDRRENNDEMRFEPVIPLPLVQNHLQRAKPKSEQTEANVIDAERSFSLIVQMRRVADQPRRQQQGDNSDGHVDVKKTPPTVVVRDESAQ